MPTITDRTRKRLSQKQLRNQCRASRRPQARKARASRRQIDRIHDQLPKQEARQNKLSNWGLEVLG